MRPALATQVLAELKRFLELPHYLRQSAFSKVKRYVLGFWAALTRFLTEPSLELHNNWSERSLRGPVISLKCSYGSHSERGLLVTAVFYSLFESAKLSEVEPAGYLRTCLQEAQKQPGNVLLAWEYAARSEGTESSQENTQAG